MKRQHLRLSALLAAVVAMCAMVTMPCVQLAYAAGLQVGGCDDLMLPGGDAAADGVDVLTVTGGRGDTVYIDMRRGDEVLASHLAFTLGDDNAQADANGDMVGVASVSFGPRAFSYRDRYAIDVYADRAQTRPLYSGTVSTDWARYGSAMQPLAVRTLAKGEERPFAMPQTSARNGMTYTLKSDKPETIDGLQVYTYEESADAPASVDGHIYYYDAQNAQGDPIKTDVVSGLAKGESRNVEVPDIVAASDGSMYRTIQLSGSVTASYPGITDFSIMCKKLDSNWGEEGSFFTANIVYVDTEGTRLGVVDSVLVNKRYLYTPPSVIYVRDGGGDTVREYALSGGNAGLNADGVLVLEPGMAEGGRDFEIAYEPVADDAERTWTVILENGSVDPADKGRVIARVTYRGRPGETATHETAQRIVVDGEDYVPAGTAQQSYEHTFAVGSADIEQTIYYVPDGWVPPEPYEVAVNYVNIADNEVITSESYTASPSMRSDLEIESPESFSWGGVEWVRLAGQERPIRHSFYAGRRTYVVYYRDINDDLHANTVINDVSVTYVDEDGNTVTRPTTVIDDGTTVTYVEQFVDGVPTYTGRTTTTVDGGTTYTDGGTTTTYVDGGTTTADGGTTTTATDGGTTVTNRGGTTTTGGTTSGGTATTAGAGASGTTGAGANAAGGTATGLQTGGGLRSISDGGGSGGGGNLVGSDGRDTATMRIDDDATPLAGPGSAQAAGRIGSLSAAAVAGVLAALAGLAALLLFLFFKRRKKSEEEDTTDEDATA